jgi:hypothetical protein
MMRDWQPDVMYLDLSTPVGLRIMLAARYRHLALTFNAPSTCEKFEASWNGGSAVAGSEDDLLAKALEELKDCGSERHDWVTTATNPIRTIRTTSCGRNGWSAFTAIPASE